MTEKTITLTPEQEIIVLAAFQQRNEGELPSITELVRLAFPDMPDIDGRSAQGRAVKKLIAERGLKVNTKSTYIPIARIELTQVQKDFITANKSMMNAVEMAKILFNNTQLTNLNNETRSVAEFLRAIQSEADIANRGRVDVPTDDYRPPKTVPGVLQRVDKYVFDHGIDKENLTAQQKTGLEALLAYLNTFRFVNQINLYESQVSRDLFESSFIRYSYDKPDLTEEEVDQYINISHDNVAMAATQVRMERLQAMMDESITNDAGERARISMGLVEAIGDLSAELDQIAKRQQSLLRDLKLKRSDRLAELRSANASILNLVQLWKEEKTRKQLLHLADARKQLVEKSAHELSGMEEIKARIMGLGIDEVVHG